MLLFILIFTGFYPTIWLHIIQERWLCFSVLWHMRTPDKITTMLLWHLCDCPVTGGDFVDAHARLCGSVLSANIEMHSAWRKASGRALRWRMIDTATLSSGTPLQREGCNIRVGLWGVFECSGWFVVSVRRWEKGRRGGEALLTASRAAACQQQHPATATLTSNHQQRRKQRSSFVHFVLVIFIVRLQCMHAVPQCSLLLQMYGSCLSVGHNHELC